MRLTYRPLALLMTLAGVAGASVLAPDPAEVPADLLTAPAGLLDAVHHAYFPGDHDPTTPSGALRWRVWARHFPEVASWASAHHGTAEWAHHFPDRARWALDNPEATTFVLNHPDVLAWRSAHPVEAQAAEEARQAHGDRALWDELTGRSEVSGYAAAPSAAVPAPAPSARVEAQVPAPAPAPAAPPAPRFQVQKPRFEVHKPPASNVIARRTPVAPTPVYAPPPQTIVVHETVPIPVYQPAPVVLRTAPRLRYRYRPRVVIHRGWGRRGWYRGGRRGGHHGRSRRRHRRWW